MHHVSHRLHYKYHFRSFEVPNTKYSNEKLYFYIMYPMWERQREKMSIFAIYICLLSVCSKYKNTHARTQRQREEIIEPIEMQNKQMRMTHNFNDRFLATINTCVSFVFAEWAQI